MRGIRGNSEAAGGCRETMGWQRVNMGSPTGADTYNTCGRLVIAILSKHYLGSRQGCQHLQATQDYEDLLDYLGDSSCDVENPQSPLSCGSLKTSSCLSCVDAFE